MVEDPAPADDSTFFGLLRKYPDEARTAIEKGISAAATTGVGRNDP